MSSGKPRSSLSVNRTVIGCAAEVLTDLTATLMPVLGEIVPLGAMLHTSVVAAAFTSLLLSVLSRLASRPVSIRVPPNGQFAPAGSAMVLTSVFKPSLPGAPDPPGDPGWPGTPGSPEHAASNAIQPISSLTPDGSRQG